MTVDMAVVAAKRPEHPGPRQGFTNGMGRSSGVYRPQLHAGAKGMTNGLGKAPGMTNGVGRTNGLTNGLGGGEGRTNGLTNGLGRTNGLTNGLGDGRGAGPTARRLVPRGPKKGITGLTAAAVLLSVALLVNMLAVTPINDEAQPDPHADALAAASFSETHYYGLYSDASALYVLINLSAPAQPSAVGVRAYIAVKDHPRPYRFRGLQASHKLDIPFSDIEQPTIYTHGGTDEYDIAGWTDPLAPGYSIPCDVGCKAIGGFAVYRIDAYRLRSPEMRSTPDLRETQVVFTVVSELSDGSFAHSPDHESLSERDVAAPKQAVDQPSRTAELPSNPALLGNVSDLTVRDGVYVATLDSDPYSGAAPMRIPVSTPSMTTGGDAPAESSQAVEVEEQPPSLKAGTENHRPRTYQPSYALTQFWINGSGGSRSYVYHEREVVALNDTGYFSLNGQVAMFDCDGLLRSFVVSGPGLQGSATCWNAPMGTRANVAGEIDKEVLLDGTGTDTGTGDIWDMWYEDYDNVLEIDTGQDFHATGFSRTGVGIYNHLNCTIISVWLKCIYMVEGGYGGTTSILYRNGSGSQTWLNSTITPSGSDTAWTNASTNITDLRSTWDWTDTDGGIEGLECSFYNDDPPGADWVQFDKLWLSIQYDIGTGGAGAALVVNEILYDPLGDDGGNQWVEIYNPSTNMSVDLGDGSESSFYIANANQSRKVYLTGTIASQGYMVVHLNASGSNSSTDCYPVIQQGHDVTASSTTYLLENVPDKNYGAFGTCNAGRSASKTHRTITYADLSSYNSFTKVTLNFYLVNIIGISTMDVMVHRLTASFDEGADTGVNDPALDGTTWNHRDRSPITAWGVAGGDFDGTANDTLRLVTADASAYIQFDITDLTNRWADSTYTNYGVMIKNGTESAATEYAAFYTDDQVGYEPYFEVTDHPDVFFNSSARDGIYLYDDNAEPIDAIFWNDSAGTEENIAVNWGLWDSGDFIDTDTHIAEAQTIGLDEDSTDTDQPDPDWGTTNADPYGPDRDTQWGETPREANTNDSIPEFSDLAIPCTFILFMFAIVRRKRRTRK